MLELLFGYWLGKRAEKKRVQQEIETAMHTYYDNDYWSSDGQDTRSLEQLLKEARENHANKNHK